MDKQVALDLIRAALEEYRSLPYTSLVQIMEKMDECPCKEVVGPDGKTYQIEVQLVWDDKPRSNLRVLASIDDGGFRAICPMTDSFILSPTGEFVGE